MAKKKGVSKSSKANRSLNLTQEVKRRKAAKKHGARERRLTEENVEINKALKHGPYSRGVKKAPKKAKKKR